MRKLLLATGCILGLCASAQAQRIAAVGGLNLANVAVKADGNKENGDTKAGVHAGIMAKLPLGKRVSFMPGLLYSMKGFKDEGQVNGILAKATMKLNYLEVPLNLVYNVDKKNSGFFLLLGPYLGYAVSGSMKLEAGGISTEVDVPFGDDAGEIKRFDFGLNAGAGYELPMGLFFKVQYGLGLSNMVSGGDGDNYIKNRVWGISAGYYFH